MFHAIVVLYNCPSLAGSSSQCLGQNINTGFQCGWCQLDFECTGDNTTCTGGPSNWLTVPSVESITPTYGPVSGGTLVTVIGNNLDIGNKENTRVLFRESSTSRRRKRHSCPETECDIKSV